MANRVPNLVKHCTVALFKKDELDGGTVKEKFMSAWKVARARLTEYGFLAEGSEEGPASRIKLTAKGRQRETKHRREAGAGSKNALFDKLYKLIEEDEQEGKADPT